MAKDVESKKAVEVNPYRFWAARFWHGMLLSAWVRLVWRNGMRIGLTKWGLFCTISFASVINSLLRPVQRVICQRFISRTQIKDAPIFIIGHWRSGTTLLHELMVLDTRYTFPTTYQCLAPNHFLVSSWLVTRFRFLLPSKRPMDNMITGWDRPQEDEFALCNMGLPSPYLTMAFPNEPPQYPEYLTLENVPREDVERWKAALQWFLQHVTFRCPKRIILKSPPHTARIKTLLEQFPDARFVHIVRDPYAVYGSTVRLWKTLYKFQALQDARHEGLEEYVYSCFETMYDSLERNRSLVDPRRFFEVRYEDLVRDPIGQMRTLYDHLGLGEFELVLPRLKEYLTSTHDYRTAAYQIPDDLRREIDRRWGPYMRRHGYCQTTETAASPADTAAVRGSA
jgi:hypothetical protein